MSQASSVTAAHLISVLFIDFHRLISHIDHLSHTSNAVLWTITEIHEQHADTIIADVALAQS